MKRKQLIQLTVILIFSILISCRNQTKNREDIVANMVIPSAKQIEYQEMEMIGFIHFSINTFTDKEWGYGDENPKLFNPEQLNAEQWVLAAKSAGLKELILTAKHHDGFCLWPSKYTEHSIKNSPYQSGKGDLVAEFVEACRKHEIKVGLYLSPWDRNHKDYGKQEYIEYYRNQLRELLTQYREINEIWFDGANGGDGYYGGANEIRKIDAKTYYDWDSTIALVKELQADISIFSDAGPDIRWVGNENGYAGATFWSTINRDEIVIGKSDAAYLNVGDPNGKNWLVGQCDVSIRPGWFYHESEDSLVKSPEKLLDIYYKSVGRNAILLLNLPPNKTGIISKNDIESIKAFKQIMDETFEIDLTSDANVYSSNNRRKQSRFSPEQILDNDQKTYWAAKDTLLPVELIIELSENTLFDRILVQEPIHLGQRVSKFQIEIQHENVWEVVFEGTTIGYKRLIRIEPTRSSKVKLTVLEANNVVAISKIGLFKSSEKEQISF